MTDDEYRQVEEALDSLLRRKWDRIPVGLREYAEIRRRLLTRSRIASEPGAQAVTYLGAMIEPVVEIDSVVRLAAFVVQAEIGWGSAEPGGSTQICSGAWKWDPWDPTAYADHG